MLDLDVEKKSRFKFPLSHEAPWVATEQATVSLQQPTPQGDCKVKNQTSMKALLEDRIDYKRG